MKRLGKSVGCTPFADPLPDDCFASRLWSEVGGMNTIEVLRSDLAEDDCLSVAGQRKRVPVGSVIFEW